MYLQQLNEGAGGGALGIIICVEGKIKGAGAFGVGAGSRFITVNLKTAETEHDYDYQLLFSFHIQYGTVDSAMIDKFEDGDEEEDEYDSDIDLYALDDQSVLNCELEIDFTGFEAIGKTFVSEDKGGTNGKSGGFGGGNGVGYLSESDDEEDDMEYLLSNG
ncbi:MAG: hypothetical protein EZS28_001255 [Streblomastix strix]|uniref:Uncharacterized protein n=1 Tax=Streblomastix strix TaxID=222440 RepID=A0A5J4X8M3_9EUKA|nr:MAG: hypothetical protein EZS28_001255 [Streblomastix strix]